jgi:hypothetical protein
MGRPRQSSDALEYLREQGVVLASAKGAVPRLIDAILGEPIRGNWWSHPKGRFIYGVLSDVCDAEEVLVRRLLGGKVTLIHRRLWPALVRVAGQFDPSQISQVHDEHTANGRHAKREIPFPRWVPSDVRERAALLTEREALALLGPVVVAATREVGASDARQRRARSSK